MKDFQQRRANESIKDANLQFYYAYTNGLKTLKFRKNKISGGQAQRIDFGKVLIKNHQPVLDEATSALNNRSEKLFVLETLQRTKGKGNNNFNIS